MFIISVWKQNYVVKQPRCLWVNLGSIGALVMHQSRCFAVSAEGGFKIINGPPRIGKGPMTSKEVSDTSNKASRLVPPRRGG
jgi:hypothetical protein